MFGSEYSSQPDILLDSFGDMSHDYKKKVSKKKKDFLTSLLQKFYIKIFGIPEIGFQIRSLYFENIISSHLANKKFSDILDAGSGVGIYSIWLAKKFKKANIVGCEIDKGKLEFSTEFTGKLNLSNARFEYGDVTRSLGSSKYDLIVNIDVLEHIEDYKKVLANFYQALNPHGYLFIHTPQPDQTRIFKSLKKWSHKDHIHEGYTHEQLTQALEKLGFKILSKKQTFGFFGKLSWELNHMAFAKGFVIAGIIYPLLYSIALVDLMFVNRRGLGTAILAVKN